METRTACLTQKTTAITELLGSAQKMVHRTTTCGGLPQSAGRNHANSRFREQKADFGGITWLSARRV
jgi:hypothetical protein